MNPVTVLIGAVAVAYGLYTLYARKNSPGNFSKLDAMKKQWGESSGNTIHVIAYSVVPIIVGLVLIVAGLRGFAFF